MICARVGLQNALKNGTKSTMLPTSAGSLAIFMSAPRWVAGDLVDAGGHRRRHRFVGHAPVLAPHPEGHVDEADQHRHLDQRADDAGEGLARSSMPNTAMLTAMASSKLLLAAVNDSVAVLE